MKTDLIQEIKSGKEEAYYSLYKQHRDDFLRWACFQHTISEDEAKDVYQDLFIIFHRNIKEGKLVTLTSDVKTYLYGIGRHLILNQLKKNKRTVTFSDAELINGYSDPFEISHQKEHNKKVVEEYLNKLPSKEQEILRLYYIEELDMKTIALKMGYKNADVAKKKKYEVFKKLSSLVKGSLKTFMIL